MYNFLEEALDLHVHSAPDVLPRKFNDIELAQRFIQNGMAGYCLKSHYFCTSERASLVRSLYPDFIAMGAIVLNSSVGGLNPAAVELAALSGAKIVWMPTCDSTYEQEHVFGRDPETTKKLPFWAKIVLDLNAQNIHCPTISLLNSNGELKQEVYDIIRIVARHDVALATGHISHQETFALARAAKQYGVENFIVTHVTFPTTFYTIEEQKLLVDCGAYMEHCVTTHLLGKSDFNTVVAQIKAIGPERVFLSTDLGQPKNPYPDEGLKMFAESLYNAGFSLTDIKMMMVDNPKKLVRV